MSNIILFLALFSLTATAVQVSLFRHWWQKLGLVLIIGLITFFFYPTAIEFSVTDIEQLLDNSKAMLDMSVILVLEAVVMLILALFMVRDMYVKLEMPKNLVLLLQYVPAVSAVGVLCFYQVHLYQQALQMDFDQIAWLYGAAVALTVIVFAALIKYFIPLRVLRLELKLAMHAAQIALAVAVSVLTANYPYRQSDIKSNLLEFGVVSLVICIGAFIGYLRYQRKLTEDTNNTF